MQYNGKHLIEIWTPKYCTDECLVAVRNIRDGENFITFTKAKHLLGIVFSVDGDVARACPIGTNGKIDVYQIPMKKLKSVGTIEY